MAIPEGYVALDLVGFTDKGTYSTEQIYMINDLVHDDGNRIWRCLQDDTNGVFPTEGSYWTLFVGTIEQLGSVDGGYFDEEDNMIAKHNAMATAHSNMAADGGVTSIQAGTITLEEHAVDENAHPNIILDGNE